MYDTIVVDAVNRPFKVRREQPMTIYLALQKEVLVARQHNGAWQTETHLTDMQPTCLAADSQQPERVYCGTFGHGLWSSDDSGRTWKQVSEGITESKVLSVAVSPTERVGKYGVVYAGTEPTTIFRSEDGGNTWREMKAIRELPSSSSWSFPPRPYTHHARWITPDPLVPGRIFVAIEAGALVRTLDGGEHWEDRVPGGPIDTHTLRMHPLVPNRLYSSAGDGIMGPFAKGKGYVESLDAGNTWHHPSEGLQHHYLYGLAVDPANPDIIIISAAPGPQQAHNPLAAESYIYQKTPGKPWHEVRQGLPDPKGTVIPKLASHPAEPGVFYALCNQGLYRSADTGLSWEKLAVTWKEAYLREGTHAIVVNED